MIEFALVTLGEGGIVPCSRCRAVSPSPLRVESVIAQLDAARAAGHSGVAFVGFEPFAHPDLPRIVAYAGDAGFERVRLRTDAGALSSPGNAPGVVGAGVRQIEVVVLGDAQEHDRMAGRQGLFAAAGAGVASFRSAAEDAGEKVAISAYVPLCEHNQEVASIAVATACSWGVTAVHIDAERLAPSGATGALLDAAVETAIVNGVCGYVTGAGFGEYGPAPWNEVTVP